MWGEDVWTSVDSQSTDVKHYTTSLGHHVEYNIWTHELKFNECQGLATRGQNTAEGSATVSHSTEKNLLITKIVWLQILSRVL